MAPITLFFGANSSGKSSIGHFLMMLKQTVESSDRKAVFYPGVKNSAVQLGSYKDMVYQHDVENRIVFEYKWDLKNTLKIIDQNSDASFCGNKIRFQSEIGYNTKKDEIKVDRFEYQLNNDNDKKSVLSVEIKNKNDKNEYTISSDAYDLSRKQGRAWALKNVVRFYGFPDEVVSYYQNADFVQRLNLEHENLFHSIYYLGPLRTKAERLYTWTGITPESVGFFGENTVAAILAAKERRMSSGFKQPIKSFAEIIAFQLKTLGLIEEFKVNPISEQRQEYEVKVRSKGSREMVDLPDVGFGISQVLPVLAQCFYAPPGSVIVMEQPEIHLHPSAQSALADVMIDVINSRENKADRNIQLIIETHSEHFLRRLQRRIAEEKISKDKVSAYFADITKQPAVLHGLEINLFGNICNWPDNFFGDEMEDISEQTKAALKRRIRQR
jgi:predicted ATPase